RGDAAPDERAVPRIRVRRADQHRWCALVAELGDLLAQPVGHEWDAAAERAVPAGAIDFARRVRQGRERQHVGWRAVAAGRLTDRQLAAHGRPCRNSMMLSRRRLVVGTVVCLSFSLTLTTVTSTPAGATARGQTSSSGLACVPTVEGSIATDRGSPAFVAELQ